MSGTVLDIIVVVVAVLLLLFGIWRGMYKLIFGLISTILVIVLAVVLVSPVTGWIVEKTTLDERLTAAIDQPLSESLPNADVVIQYYDLDNDGIADELGYVADGVVHEFSEIFNGTGYSIFSGIVESVISKHIDENESTAFVTVLCSTLVGYIIIAIVFIVLLIIFAIIVKIIMTLIKKFVTRTYIGHFINKLVGAVLGLVIAMIIIWGALAVIRLLGTYEWIIPVNNVINDSTLTKLLYDKNIIYDFLVNNFNIQEAISNMLSGSN